jgi:hypothetical protein
MSSLSKGGLRRQDNPYQKDPAKEGSHFHNFMFGPVEITTISRGKQPDINEIAV